MFDDMNGHAGPSAFFYHNMSFAAMHARCPLRKQGPAAGCRPYGQSRGGRRGEQHSPRRPPLGLQGEHSPALPAAQAADSLAQQVAMPLFGPATHLLPRPMQRFSRCVRVLIYNIAGVCPQERAGAWGSADGGYAGGRGPIMAPLQRLSNLCCGPASMRPRLSAVGISQPQVGGARALQWWE